MTHPLTVTVPVTDKQLAALNEIAETEGFESGQEFLTDLVFNAVRDSFRDANREKRYNRDEGKEEIKKLTEAIVSLNEKLSQTLAK